jgi:hypothetical protein
MARDDARLAWRQLQPAADEITRAERAACAFELDLLIDEVLALPPGGRSLTLH